jgi:hypothetical protein
MAPESLIRGPCPLPVHKRYMPIHVSQSTEQTAFEEAINYYSYYYYYCYSY